jgi:multidrug resistance efflux pump
LKRLLLVIAIVCVATVGLLLMRRTENATAPVAPPSGQTGGSTTSAPSSSNQPTASLGTGELHVPAVLEADEEIDVYAKISGYVAELRVDIGARVRKGDALLIIDAPEILADAQEAEATVTAKQARLAAARAKVEQSSLLVEAARAEMSRCAAEYDLQKLTAARKEELFKGNAIPQQEVDDARGRLAVVLAQSKTAEAKVAAAQGDLRASEADQKVADAEIIVATARRVQARTLASYARITAAFDGVITRRLVDVGAFVKSAAQATTGPLFTLTRQDKLRLRLEIPESQSPRVSVGTPVLFQVRSHEGQAFHAKISRTSLVLRSDSRTMLAEADVDNAEAKLQPGMFAQATVQLAPNRAEP